MDGFDLGSIVAHIRAETTEFTAAMERAKAQADGVATHVSTIAAGVALAVDAIVVGFGVESVKAFANAQVITAQLEQVLKTTGKNATMSAEQVHALAMSLEEYSGRTHESIEAGQTILLQFAGITKDTLPQASRAMVDVAQRMGVDMVSAAKTLGIALDNPDVGFTRLKREGIDFSVSQIAAIKALQKSGDTAGAAAMMMQILETKVGGAGGAYRKTLAGGISEAHAKLTDFEILLGGKIINTLNEAYQWYQKHARILNDIAGVLGTLLGVIAAALVLYGNWIVLTKVLIGVQKLLAIAMDMNPIVLGILAVVAVAAILLEHWKLVKQWFMDFVHDVAGFFHQLWKDIDGVWQGMVRDAENIFDDVLKWFKNLPKNILNAMGDVSHLLFDAGKSIISGLINGLENMVGKAVDKVKNVGKSIINGARDVLGWFSPSKVFHEAGLSIGQGLINGMNAMQDAVGGASIKMAMSAVAPASSVVNNAGSSSTINTSITGPINIGTNADANRFLAQLTYNQELAQKGLTPVR